MRLTIHFGDRTQVHQNLTQAEVNAIITAISEVNDRFYDPLRVRMVVKD